MACFDFNDEGSPRAQWQTSCVGADDRHAIIRVGGVELTLEHVGGRGIGTDFDGGTGGVLWDGAQAMARYLEARGWEPGRLKSMRVIELGSGCTGVGGLTMSLLGAAEVVVTDQAPLLGTLRKNVEGARSAAAAAGVSMGAVAVHELEWSEPEQVAPLGAPFDLVVCSDCTYSDLHYEILRDTAASVCGPATEVIFVDTVRTRGLDARFETVFGEQFQIRRLKRAELPFKDVPDGCEVAIMTLGGAGSRSM